MIFVGNDWAEDHHDVYLMDEGGTRLGFARLPEGIEGVARFHQMVAEHTTEVAEVVVGVETDRGLWVGALIGAGYQVYAINPKAVSRYRDRHRLGGAKSDRGDAKVLADLVRTDRHNHRPVAGDSPGADGIKVLARTHQNLIWAKARHTNQVRNALREYYPAALETFSDLADRDTVAVLGRAPTPTLGARLTLPQIRAALKRGGRRRNLDKAARRIQKGLRAAHLTAPGPVADAYGATVAALVSIIGELNRQISEIEATLHTRFEQHPDAAVYLSQPGLGKVLGARALGEFGDDPDRYTSAKSRRNYAGTSPITIASGRKRAVLARHVRNRRLYDALDQWAFCSLTNSPGAREFYDQKRAAGDLHHQALRALANRLARSGAGGAGGVAVRSRARPIPPANVPIHLRTRPFRRRGRRNGIAGRWVGRRAIQPYPPVSGRAFLRPWGSGSGGLDLDGSRQHIGMLLQDDLEDPVREPRLDLVGVEVLGHPDGAGEHPIGQFLDPVRGAFGDDRRAGALDGQQVVVERHLEILEPESGELVADGQSGVRLDDIDPR